MIELNERLVGRVKIIALSGSFDAYHASTVRKWFETVTLDEPANIIVNLGEVNFLDSTGLSVLVQGLKRTRQANGDLRLCSIQQPVRMVFELTRLDRVFEIYNEEDEALLAFADCPSGNA